MSLTCRVITTETGKEVMHEDGTPAANVAVGFTLSSEGGGGLIVADAETGNMILPKTIIANTDSLGGLSVSLWPTSRGDVPCFYTVAIAGGPYFRAPLPDGVGSFHWEDFVLGRLLINL